MFLSDVFTSVTGVVFFNLISKITNVNLWKVVILFSITILPAMWVETYFYAAAFYNHFIGLFIGLITYYGYMKNWEKHLLIVLTFIVGNTGVLTSIPILVVLFWQFRRWEVISGALGFLLFYSFPCHDIRAWGTMYNGEYGRFPIYHLPTMIKKVLISWEYFAIPALITLLNYKRIINDRFTQSWVLGSAVCLLLVSIAPISYIGMHRWTFIIIALYTIPLLTIVKWNLGYKLISIATALGLFLNLAALDAKREGFLEDYFINFEIRYNTKEFMDNMIERGKYYKQLNNNKHEKSN